MDLERMRRVVGGGGYMFIKLKDNYLYIIIFFTLVGSQTNRLALTDYMDKFDYFR